MSIQLEVANHARGAISRELTLDAGASRGHLSGPVWAGVAQLAEQLICNQQVAGSSPITSSTFIIHGGIPERPKGADCKSVVNDFGGSNPPPSTIR